MISKRGELRVILLLMIAMGLGWLLILARIADSMSPEPPSAADQGPLNHEKERIKDKLSSFSEAPASRSWRLMEKSLGGYVPTSDWSNLTHLIMVAGHTVYMGTDFTNAGSQGDRWFLYDYQRDQFDWFLQHITAGVKLAHEDPASLLLFSGGATRILAGPRTEAQSYWLYADAQDWFLDTSKYTRVQIEALKHRVHTEDFARDSFENLLFSICRFRQLTDPPLPFYLAPFAESGQLENEPKQAKGDVVLVSEAD
eukprot:763583-Hanusia_phi.AAC.8